MTRRLALAIFAAWTVAACQAATPTATPASTATPAPAGPTGPGSTASPGQSQTAQSATPGSANLTFYWISNGATDAYWVPAVQGADQAGSDLHVTVKTSLHAGDVAAQKEAIAAAIAAHADGIATVPPAPGAINDLVAKARAAGIPVVFLDTDDPSSGRDAYIGADLVVVGRQWAQYLVDQKLVKAGDNVWLPVELPGAAYQVDETKGIASVFDPLGIKYSVFDANYDPATSLANMTTYVTGNKAKIAAVIGLGDLVMSNIEKVFTSAGIAPGSIPVVGWGNTNTTAQAVLDGYVNSATWAAPNIEGYDSILELKQIHDRMTTGYDIATQQVYDKSTAEKYVKLLTR